MRSAPGTAAAFVLASGLTLAMAWPVVRAPTAQIFGQEIVGRHYDPFVVMQQMAGAGAPGPYAQPLTDWTGWLLARVLDPVAAYNVIVLLTFPLTAAATYALARYLQAPHGAALGSALFFAFAPLHLAHAAYHPHIAQTQWLPLYLLALFATIDRPSPRRVAGLAAAGAALVLSNFYSGLTSAIVTPVALIAYWWASPRGERRQANFWIVAGILTWFAAAGLALIAFVYPQLLRNASTYAFPIEDVPRYSARWWAYFVPPVSHPLMGKAATDIFQRAGVASELLEQQVYLGFALLALAIGAGGASAIAWRAKPERRAALVLWALAIAAALVSIGPLEDGCSPESWAPACVLYGVAPMFRAYARLAFVPLLAMAIAGALGASWLVQRSRMGRMAAACLIAAAVFEYWPFPARARDVLPTQGHRWLAERLPEQRTLDCMNPDLSVAQVPWLMRRHLSFLDGSVPSCLDPHLGSRLAALGYTHVLIHRVGDAPDLPSMEVPEAGLTEVARFPDSQVYAVTAPVPAIAVVGEQGFFDYERAGRDVWRWMGPNGHWQVRNTTGETQAAAFSVDLESLGWPRRLDVTLDGAPIGSLQVSSRISSYTFGPMQLAPGDHAMAFAAVGRPFRPSEHGSPADTRSLTFAFRNDTWTEWNQLPDERAR